MTKSKGLPNSETMKPKFQKDDRVKYKKPDLFGCTEGVVTHTERIFKAFEDGAFDNDGLSIMEDTITSFAVPYELDGDTLTVYMPEREITSSTGAKYTIPAGKTRVYKFNGYAVTCVSDKMCSSFSERSLSKIN